MPTEALGSANEAHRRWPEGRSEQGASKAKDGPSHFRSALAREGGEHGRLDRERHSRRKLIGVQSTPCVCASKGRVGAPPLTHLRGKVAFASLKGTPLRG